MSYRIDHKGIHQWARMMGVEGELEIVRKRRRVDPRTGWYTMREDTNGQHRHWSYEVGQRHRISLDSGLPAHEAARTLAHELCHAVQASNATAKGGRHGWRDRVNRERRTRYAARPIEIEAREWSDRFGACLLRDFFKVDECST